MGRWPHDNQAELIAFFGTPGPAVERRKSHKNRPGFRFCNKCDQEFALTVEHFPSDINRKSGFGYQCRGCVKLHQKPDARRNRWALTMTPEQRDAKREWLRRYTKTERGNASHRVASYRQIDAAKGQTCDLTSAWFVENIASKACTYCGDTESIGCDRIDNALGHTKANVVPCCFECNIARLDNFTHSEMRVIGAAIAEVKACRKMRAAA